MSNQKKQVRATFRHDTFKRDGFRCRFCKKQATPETAESILDAHHISPREEMLGGGYVKENGITLCKGNEGSSCHEKAEAYLKGENTDPAFAPSSLYLLIGSSRETAEQASKKLEE